MAGNEYEFLDEAELSDFPGLMAVSQFVRMLGQAPWFGGLGAELDGREELLAEDYLLALGFPDARIAPILDWEEAAAAAANPDWNTEWWEAEEQVRVALVTEACQRADEETVMVALTHLQNQSVEAVLEPAELAAEAGGVDDPELIRAAVGAGAQAIYQAALLLAAEHEDDEHHVFALKYRLFESGRWPIGVVGNSFHIF
ncbi:MAG: hypothetical protein QGG19_02920 [Alphaproteobacteria bacterium]|jgi:hypothetical protein|nr:hypothetical protein [Alphaproteobacteria bacterium]MDP6256076.1 hypothetical protein [Alphaproteobacteria bacterium]MDP7054305.1 hypothetical protein [Alphaproteobacteria bacterium]MDP7230602.1 hypothetical protein [Alphaproteobacteria bacterium]MDP7459381.1 hypothetical protein [Alphaproteobacteria bacterium]